MKKQWQEKCDGQNKGAHLPYERLLAIPHITYAHHMEM
jgi:hypothetical protein